MGKRIIPRVTKIGILFSIGAISFALSACQGSSIGPASKLQSNANNNNNTGTCSGNGGGGCDASGGDLLASTHEEIQAAFDKAVSDLKSGLLSMMAKNLQLAGETSRLEQNYDSLTGPGSFKLVTEFLKVQADRKSETDEAVKLGKVQFNLSKDLCPSKNGDKDGSAIGDLNDGKICVSAKGFLNKPQKDLNQEMLAILVHEISHLVGFDEDKASAIQKLISTHPAVYQADYNDTKYNSDIKCSSNSEIEEIEKSKYWNLRLSEIQNYLGSQINCDQGQAQNSTFQVYSNLNFALDVNEKSKLLQFKIENGSSGTNLKGDNFPELLRSPYTSDFNSLLGWFYADPVIGIKVSEVKIKFNVEAGSGKGLYVFKGVLTTPTECSHKQLIANVRAAISVFTPLGCHKSHLIYSDEKTLDKVKRLADQIMKNETGG